MKKIFILLFTFLSLVSLSQITPRLPVLNKILVQELRIIFYDDQTYRVEAENAEKKYGFDSKEVKELWEIIRKKDVENLIKVKTILDKYGWIGPDEVGEEGSSTLFLVIQHSDQKTQEKYLPMMREAVKKGNAFASDLALLEDRVALGQGKKQIYGSQMNQDQETGKYTVSPIEDEANVNKRRAAVGLEPIEEYVKYWGIVYKPVMSNQQIKSQKSNSNKKNEEQGRNNLILIIVFVFILAALGLFIYRKKYKN